MTAGVLDRLTAPAGRDPDGRRRLPRPPAWSGWLLAAVVVVLVLPALSPGRVPRGVVLQGAEYGAATGLTALGLVLTYRASRIINFAYGAMGGLAATVAVELHLGRNLPWPVCIPLGLLAGGVLGGVVEVLVIRRFFTAPRLILTVATIGLAQVVSGVQLLVPRWLSGPGTVGGFETSLSRPHLNVGAVLFDGNDLLLVAAVPVVVAGLSYFLLRTDSGRAVRAVADNGDRALLLGIPIRRLSTLVWVVAGVVAAVPATLQAPGSGLVITSGAGPTLILPALAAAIVAKFESLPVAFGSGVAVGVLYAEVRQNTTKSSATDLAFLLVILVALLLQRRAAGRGNTDDTSWSAAGALAPIPAALRRLPEVRLVRGLLVAVLAFVALYVPYHASASRELVYTFALVYGMVAVSLVVLSGWGGQVSLGQYAFVGVGSTVAGNLIEHHNLDLFVSLLAAAAAGAVIAVVVGLPALRISGLYLAVTTLALAVAVNSFFLNPTYFDSLVPQSVTPPVLWKRFDLGAPAHGQRAIYYLTLGVLLAVIAAVTGLRRARAGRVLLATRDNERAAAAMAVPTVRVKLVGFVLAGAICGVAGGLHALAIGGEAYNTFEPSQSLLVFSMAVIGGLSSISGALLGVALIEVLVHAFPQYQLIITGAGLLLILLVLPGGLGQAVQRVRDLSLRQVARRRGLLDTGDPVDLLAAAVEPAAPEPAAIAPAAADADTGPVPVVDLTAAGPAVPDAGTGRPPATGRLADDEGHDALLRCRDVRLSYGGTRILFGIDLDVHPGEVVALLGTNGAGKSTLLKAVTGLAAKSHGSVHLGGRDISRTRPDELARAGISMMPGGRGVFPSLTVRENLRLAAWTIRGDAAAVRAAHDRMLALFPVLATRRDQSAGTMSGGEQQQLSLAMALMTSPQLLLIDELSLGLAPTVVGQLIEVVRQLNRDGVTVVVVEQSVNVALELAERAVFLEKGQVRFAGRTADLLDRPDVLRSVFIAGAGAVPAAVAGAPKARRRRGEAAAARAAEKEAALAGAERAERIAAAEVVLAVRGVSLSFGGIRALRSVELELRRGEVVGLVGHNGAGKTTLFDCISGFLRPDAGTVLLGGDDVTALPATARAWIGLGRSFQEARLFGSLTVAETVSVALERHLASRDLVAAALRLPASTDSEDLVAAKVAELLELTGLTTYAERVIGQLSTGTRRIVELACVLAQEPAVLLLDEPSGGVAQKETEALGPMLRRVAERTGCSMLVIEHDMPLLAGLCDRLVAFELGEKIAEGPPAYVLEHPQVVASYLGTDEVAVNRSGAKKAKNAKDTAGTPVAAKRGRQPAKV